MNSDYIWLILGSIFGYITGLSKKSKDIPKDLEECNIQKNQQDIDLAYYKKLTKILVEENAELRKKINEAKL